MTNKANTRSNSDLIWQIKKLLYASIFGVLLVHFLRLDSVELSGLLGLLQYLVRGIPWL